MFPDVIRKRHWAALAAFLIVIFLFQLGTRGLNEPDEGRYANIAEEALENDHPWWEPQLADIGHYDKPPLIYWVTAFGFYFFGINEWAARLPSLAGAILTLTGLGWAAIRLYGQRIAWLTVLVAGTMLHIWVLGRVLTPDMFLTGWCTLAIAAWTETRRAPSAWRWWILQVLFWTLAGWTKATPALIPMLGLAVFVYVSGQPTDRRALKLPLLLPLVILLSSPWYVWILYNLPELKEFFLDREMLSRITGHIPGRQCPFYYYVPISMITWLPWWPLAVIAWLRQRKNRQFHFDRWRSCLSPELCILVTGFCIFSIVGSKLPTYTLPLAPWAALVMSRLLAADAFFSRISVLSVTAGLAALVYTGLLFLVPSRDDAWGRNSSMRSVTDFLHKQNAVGIHADRFWPSLEFYWDENLYYTSVIPPEEVPAKADNPQRHFESSINLKSPANDWFIHYQKQDYSPYRKWLDDPNIPKTRIGDFVVGPLR